MKIVLFNSISAIISRPGLSKESNNKFKRAKVKFRITHTVKGGFRKGEMGEITQIQKKKIKQTNAMEMYETGIKISFSRYDSFWGKGKLKKFSKKKKKKNFRKIFEILEK